MTETLANGYSYESTQWELSYEYQHERVKMFFENLCVFVHWTKVALALEGLKHFQKWVDFVLEHKVLEVEQTNCVWIFLKMCAYCMCISFSKSKAFPDYVIEVMRKASLFFWTIAYLINSRPRERGPQMFLSNYWTIKFYKNLLEKANIVIMKLSRL